MAKPLSLLGEICSAPGSDDALRFDAKARAVAADGTRYRALKGVPVLRDESTPLKQFPKSHLSSAITPDRIDYMCGLPGYTLLLGGGNTAFSHPNVVDVEFNLYANTDVVADAHVLPFKSDSFDLFFAMNVFEHLRQPFLASAEAMRVLKPGGELHIHTAFLQPLHEEPVHYFNATEFGGREWLRDFDSVECSVSPNFNPLYSLAWISSDLLGQIETHLGKHAAETIGKLSVAEVAEFWSRPAGWNSEAREIFFKLPEAVQRRCAAGFDFRARKPIGSMRSASRPGTGRETPLGDRSPPTLHAVRPRRSWKSRWREAAVIARSRLFDTAHYCSQRPELRGGRMRLLWHYLSRGAGEGVNPHPLFDTRFYLRKNPDVVAAGANPLAHYLMSGALEGRAPTPRFDSARYLEDHPDVAERGWNPLVHYVQHGVAEGRDGRLRLDAVLAQTQHDDDDAGAQLRVSLDAFETEAGAAATRVRDAELRSRISASGFFDEAFYRESCGVDFGSSQELDPISHFLRQGSAQGLRFCSAESLARRLRAFDVDDASQPELSLLRTQPLAVAKGRVVAIHVSSVGNSFFREIAALLAHGFRAAGAEVLMRHERDAPLADSDCDIVVAPHEFFLLGEGPARLTPSFIGRCSLWLSEQPGSEFFSICLCFARFARSVLDVNPLTARMWGALGFRARAFPLGYVAGFEPYEDRRGLLSPSIRAGQTPEVRDYAGSVEDAWSERPLDIFCNAVLTRRRQLFLAGNAEFFSSLRCAFFVPTPTRPLSSDVASALGAEDATALGQRAKIQLNLHRGDLSYFAWHRLVVRGIWQKSLVVTEPCLPVPGLVAGEHYVECELDEMPQTLHRLLRTPAGREEAEAIRDRAFRKLAEAYPLQAIASAFLTEEATWPR